MNWSREIARIESPRNLQLLTTIGHRKTHTSLQIYRPAASEEKLASVTEL